MLRTTKNPDTEEVTSKITNPAIPESMIIPNCAESHEIMGTITQSLAPTALRSESRLLCPVFMHFVESSKPRFESLFAASMSARPAAL